jgi:hypothetical protein
MLHFPGWERQVLKRLTHVIDPCRYSVMLHFHVGMKLNLVCRKLDSINTQIQKT